MSSAARTVREAVTGDPPGFTHPEWAERFPWLIQGTTARGTDGPPFDLGLFSDASPPARVLERWERLGRRPGVVRTVHARQVHGASVRVHGAGPPGLHLAPPCDGHVTATPGVLLAVTVADCVPVSLVDERRRAVGLLHAGWRGAAAGVVERGLTVLGERLGTRPGDVHVHLGPSICGSCYEVGAEVFEALGLPVPAGRGTVDLPDVLARRSVAAGVPPERITRSDRCSRCEEALFSHRGGDAARQAAYLGLRA